MDDTDPGGPAEGTPRRPGQPRFYLPIVFWLGCILLAFGLVAGERTPIVGGALVMAWGLFIGAVAHWAHRTRAGNRTRRGER